jgi:hypothetical protein
MALTGNLADKKRAGQSERGGGNVNGFLKVLCVLVGLVGVGSVSMAQDTHIVVQVVDGRNGKPLANRRLVVFGGESPESVRQHKRQFELVTNKQGLADFTIAPSDTHWIQVWVDWHILCQSEPNKKSFSVAEILSTGLSMTNTCGSSVQKVTPGRIVVFARPAHFWEKLRE